MGGSVSRGRNNDELVDNLIDAEYIRTPVVESAFRSVDRGDYIPETGVARLVAYKDIAWRNGSIHLSASCIYSEVMEYLELRPGLSFLNIGSGTGYLSTMVGLILGPTGVNHGIEEKEAAVKFAESCLEKFTKNQLPKLVHFNFCRPKFIVGNIFLWKPTILYDRIYCGADCPAEGLKFIKLFLKINGILVIPVGHRLVQIVRRTYTEFTKETITNVSFARLVKPTSIELLQEPLPANPPTLMQLCISEIRNELQRSIFQKHPEFKNMHRTIVKAERLLLKEENEGNEDNSEDSNNKSNKRRPPFDFYNPDCFKKPRLSFTKVLANEPDNDGIEDLLNDHSQVGNDGCNFHIQMPRTVGMPPLVNDEAIEEMPAINAIELSELEAAQNAFLDSTHIVNIGEVRAEVRRRYGQVRGSIRRFRRGAEAYEQGQPSTSRGSGPLRSRLERSRYPHFYPRDSELLEYHLDDEDSDTDSVNSHIEGCRANRHRGTMLPYVMPTGIIDPLVHSSLPQRLPNRDTFFQLPDIERAPVQASSLEPGINPAPEMHVDRAGPLPPDPAAFNLFEMNMDDLPESISSLDSDSSSGSSDEEILISENDSILNDSDDYSDFERETQEYNGKEKLPPNKFSKFLKLYHNCLNSELNNLGLPYMLKNLIGYTKPDASKDTEDI